MQKVNLLLLGCLVCFGQVDETLLSKQNSTPRKSIDGTYEYRYPYNTKNLVENQYIILKAGAGLYYGTSDEFGSGREGVPPGFFVADMQKLRIFGDSISFKIKITSADLFEKPLFHKSKSSESSRKFGYKIWKNKIPLDEKWYLGKINGHYLFFKHDIADFDKKFVKIQ